MITTTSKYKGHKIVRYAHGDGSYVVYNSLGHKVAGAPTHAQSRRAIDSLLTGGT